MSESWNVSFSTTEYSLNSLVYGGSGSSVCVGGMSKHGFGSRKTWMACHFRSVKYFGQLLNHSKPPFPYSWPFEAAPISSVAVRITQGVTQGVRLLLHSPQQVLSAHGGVCLFS